MSTEQAVSAKALERFQRPRNYGPLDQWDGHARVTGPCGDTMEFWLKVVDRRIAQVSFITDGCGPSRAAGSMATELATGRLVKEALQIEQRDVLKALRGLPKESEHCALLAANTLKAAIRDCQQRRQTAQQCGECSKTECSSKQRGADESEQDFRDRQALAIADVRRSVSFCEKVSMPVVGIIENMSGLVCPHCGGQIDLFKTGGGESLAQEMGVPLLGRIPLDPQIVTCGDGGIPYIHRFADSPAGRAFAEVVACEQALNRRRGHLVLTEEPTAVFNGLMVTGPVPRVTEFEDTGGPFFLDPQCRIPDPIVDDRAVFFESTQGTVVLLGCAHAGVINTLRYVRHLNGDRPIHAVLGGMHLIGASAQRLKRTIDELRDMEIDCLSPAHCTGRAATAALWDALPGQCIPYHVGTQVEFDLLTPSPSLTGVQS